MQAPCLQQVWLTVEMAIFERFACVCAMAMYCNFSNMDKVPKLPNPTGSLSLEVFLCSIVLANGKVKSMLAEE